MACSGGLNAALTTEFVCKKTALAMTGSKVLWGREWSKEGQLGDGMVSSHSSAAKWH